MSLSKTLYPLLSIGSTQEHLSRYDRKTVDWDVKNKKYICNLSEPVHEILVLMTYVSYVSREASALTLQSLCCSHTQRKELDEQVNTKI